MSVKQFDFHKLPTLELSLILARECAANARLREMLTAYCERIIEERHDQLIKYPPDMLTASVSNRELGREESMKHLLSIVNKEQT